MNYFNTEQAYWESYGKKHSAASPTGGVSVTINNRGEVGNSRYLLARFPNAKAAKKTLQVVGFKITKQNGCGHVQDNLNARFVTPNTDMREFANRPVKKND